MTQNEVLAINGLNKKQLATIKRWYWEASKKNVACKLDACATAEEVVAMVNASFKKSEAVEPPKTFSLASLSISELEALLAEIPNVIAAKKAEKLAEIDEQIKALQAQKKELSK